MVREGSIIDYIQENPNLLLNTHIAYETGHRIHGYFGFTQAVSSVSNKVVVKLLTVWISLAVETLV